MSAIGYVPEWPAPGWVRAYQTLRRGGVSRGPYASLNLALHVDDVAAHVEENRRRLGAAARLPAAPCWLEQVHGNRIVDLDAAWSGPADGAVTGVPGRVCAVLTADCLPVLLAARRAHRVGVAHAGWRGLAAGVLPAAVDALGVDPAELVAWLGPAIGPRVYEVGAEVRAALLGAGTGDAQCFAPSPGGRWLADLYALARASLETAGVRAVHGGGDCTLTDAERFYSHRREAPCGRMATLVWIEAGG